jgi:lysyl-tRNA synthetase class 2
MSAGSRSEPDARVTDWRPGADLPSLQLRAALLRRVRAWFDARGCLEVETPALSPAGTTDPALESLSTRLAGRTFYLHTSPELPMKRLLAAGAGDIWQLCRVFRGGELGRRHNPEFTLLEFYRLGLDEHGLMDEVDALLRHLLTGYRELEPTRRIPYAEACAELADVDPHRDGCDRLRDRLAAAGVDVPDAVADDRDGLLDLVLAAIVEPGLDPRIPVFVHDFPASQAALARIRPGPPPVAARFELFFGGMELANGFHELTDPGEQAERFERDRAARARAGLECPPVDRRFLAALAAGLPECAGVALGFDRLVMCAAGCDTIDEVMSFGVERA